MSVPPGQIGTGGYAFAFSDGVTPGGSTACLNPNQFCGKGTTGVVNPPSYTIYGAGIGLNLSQVTGATAWAPFAATGSGIAYALTSLPPGTRLIIDNGATTTAHGTDYCFNLTAATGTIPWSMFYTQCYNLPSGDAGASLGSAPATASHIQFQINSAAAAGSFDFCVTSLKFM